jgi:hypothetical protein
MIENKNVVTNMLDRPGIAEHCALLHVRTRRPCGLGSMKRKLRRLSSPLT